VCPILTKLFMLIFETGTIPGNCYLWLGIQNIAVC
jgi:hypothetical protein